MQQAIDACQADSTVLVLFGDVPLIADADFTRGGSAAETGVAMFRRILKTPLVMVGSNATSQGEFIAVVEEKDATEAQRQLTRD